MGLPLHATINDMKRLIHSRLCEVNSSRPIGERVPDATMKLLDIDWRGPLDVRPRHGEKIYVLGAQLFCRFVDQLEHRDGLPLLFAFIG